VIDEKDIMVPMSDGVRVALRIYRPAGAGPFPALYAASPYRYDNNELPATPQFLWRETGPIEWYLEQGYAYVHADVRGTGKSEGEYALLDRREQRDHHEVIDWIARQPWSSGKVGGIGQSYYCLSQWFMAIQAHPALACIAAYDGGVDLYHCKGPRGGIESQFATIWFNQSVRIANLFPANRDAPRVLPRDISYEILQHPLYDEFWRERAAIGHLHKIKTPLFSVGAWAKQDLHLDGNLIGYQRAEGEKKLFVIDTPSLFAVAAAFESIDFHRQMFLPFYDHYLKGLPTSHRDRPAVAFNVRNSDVTRAAGAWPPPGLAERSWRLSHGPAGAVKSLNDGALTEDATEAAGSTSYSYPDPQWVLGSTAMSRIGPDPIGRALTFTSPALEADLELCGKARLVLFASSSRQDTDFFVKLSDQTPEDGPARQSGGPTRSTVVTKACFRASHRADVGSEVDAIDGCDHTRMLPLTPGKVERFVIEFNPMSYRFRKGSRLRLEIANIDTPLTEFAMAHFYDPSKIGRDTIEHNQAHPSMLVLPVYPGVAD
jgi:predicted acyl esterase